MAENSHVNYWTLVTILGPLLLLAVIAWVVIRQRKQTPRENERTEQGTRDVYAEEQRAHENDKSSGL
jgi:hypothetical protein